MLSRLIGWGILLLLFACNLPGSDAGENCLRMGTKADTLMCFEQKLGADLPGSMERLKKTGIRKEYIWLDVRVRRLIPVFTEDGKRIEKRLFLVTFIDQQTGHVIYKPEDVLSESGEYYRIQQD